ncbi:hypothetical protein TeGR_g4546 [Tetraparma gracilis]|uniref:Uncharacterized protein n=1 Tax=Tetraparma gracilis TaxID=2962635 RepID=A0ABQ6MHR1_9STRA|nr:hypothetical protein TeGR_g4546 [Tetraparma gracilis]
MEFAGLFDNVAEREAAQAAELEIKNVRVAEELEIENARVAEELEIKNAARAAELESAARAAEDSLLAELDAEDAAAANKKKKKKKKKKKASGKKGTGTQQAESDDWRSAFQRYEQSDMMRGVDQRKRQRNLEEAARIMAAHEQKIAALPFPPSLAPPRAATPAAPNALKETTVDIEAQMAALGLDLAAGLDMAALGLDLAPLSAPDELAETAEDIDAQIAALGPPPDFPPTPPPAAAPDAFLESLLPPPPPAPPAAPRSHGEFLEETVAELHTLVFGAEEPLPPGNYLLALLERLPPGKARLIAELVHGVVQL